MALLRKLFYKKPPDGLLEISERVYVFDCCFTIDPWDQDNYKGYIGSIVSQLKDHYPEASILIFNFREGDTTSQLASALSDHDMTIVEYPRHYEGCPILSMEAIHHFLRSGESWLSFGMQNVLLMHCERGGWPVLAFMLAALLIYRKYYSGETKTLDMVYKQAPNEVLHLFSSLNPLPSQLRYLQYVSRRNVATEWPPLDRALSLDCVIMRMIPDVDGEGGCRPIFRIYGQDPYMPGDKATKLLFSTPKWSKNVRYYKQAECEVVIIDINCHIQGDIVLECINYLVDDDEVEHENIMYRAMFNTSFIRSNILIVNRDEIDVLWDANFEFPNDFKAEFLFSEMDAAASIIPFDAYFFDEKDTIPIEAFSKVQEMFSSVDWPSPTNDAAIDKGKKRAGSSENDPKSSGQLAKENSFVSQEHLDTSRRSVSSSTSTSPKYLSESEPVHPYLRGQQETHLHESTASSKNLATGVDKSPSAKSTQLLKETADNEVTTMQLEPLSKTHPPTQPAFPPSILHSPSLKDIEAKVEPSLTVPSQKSPSRSSREDRAPTAQTSRTPRRSQDSPPLSPPTPPLKEKLATGGEPTPPCTPTRPTSPSPDKSTDKPGPSPSPHSLAETKNEKPAKIIGPSPSPPPPTETNKEKPMTTAGTYPTSPVSPPPPTAPTKEKPERTVRPSPTPPVSPPPPTAPTKEKPEKTAGPSSMLPASPPPSTTPTKEKPERTAGPSPMPPVSPPPSTAPTKEKTERTDGPSPMPPVSPPPSTAPTKEKPERTAGPSPMPPVSPPPSTAHTKEKPERTAGPFPMPPVSPPPSTAPTKERPEMGTTQSYTPAPTPAPLPPPPPTISLKETPITKLAPPPPPPPTPPPAGPGKNNGVASPVPPPPPPIPSSNQNEKGGVVPPPPPPSRANSLPGAPPPPLGRGRGLSLAMKNQQGKKLKPLHWLKLTRAVQGSLWAETQKSGEAVKTPEIDIKELENLFSAANPNQDKGGAKAKSTAVANKPEKVQLIEHRRACNCEIMLSKVKIPLSELMDYVLALDESALDVDQVDNLIKFCPTKEEIDMLKGYKGEKDKLGKCEQFFMELMKVPRTESKLRVFSFKLQFGSQVSDLRKSLNSVNSAVEEVRSSSKFKRVMQTILTLGNALNQGTARGSAVGFRLDSLLKLTDTRARNNRMTLMHYLCKVLSEKLPELLDFSKELESLEPASKVQLKYLAEEMQSISKGLEKVVQELSTAENDGPVSEKFIKALKEFLCSAEGEARALASLYSLVGKNVDALILYFGEDPARCPYEHVVSTLRNFVRMFNQAHEENCKKLEAEKKKAEKEASNELAKPSDSKIESENIKNSPVKTV